MAFTSFLGDALCQLANIELAFLPPSTTTVSDSDAFNFSDATDVNYGNPKGVGLIGSVGTALTLIGSVGTALAAAGSALTAQGLTSSVGTALGLTGSIGTVPTALGSVGTALPLTGSVNTAQGLTGSRNVAQSFGASQASQALTGSAGTAQNLTASGGTQVSLAGNKNMATTANIEFYKGEDDVLTVSMSPATNITGWTIKFTVRKNYNDPTALITKTVGSGITVTDATNGVFTITIASADTSGLDLRAYAFDVQRTSAGNRTVLTIGNLTLLPEVSL
jgi:hypothetical protein